MERVEGTCGAEAVTDAPAEGCRAREHRSAPSRGLRGGEGSLDLPVGVGCCQHKSRSPD